MPKNTKKRKNTKNSNSQQRRVITKTEDQDYAVVIKILGDARYTLRLLTDDRECMGSLRGSIRKRSRVFVDSVVLCSFREFDARKVDILVVYFPNEVDYLRGMKEIPANVFGHIEKEEEDIIFVEDDVFIESI